MNPNPEAEDACGRPGAHWVVQKYIERPLLVGGRKFDIRAYALVAPCGRVFMHRSAYARTSSSAFGLSDLADRRALRLLARAPPAAAAHIWHHQRLARVQECHAEQGSAMPVCMQVSLRASVSLSLTGFLNTRQVTNSIGVWRQGG